MYFGRCTNFEYIVFLVKRNMVFIYDQFCSAQTFVKTISEKFTLISFPEDSTARPTIAGKSALLIMIWSRISRRTHLSPYIKALQNTSPESR